MSEIVVNNQWNDFLVRQVDPYAACKYEILLGWIGSVSGKTILVIGSGSGEFAALLAKAGGRVTALDISDECIRLTQATAAQFGVTMQTMVNSIENCPTDKKYDIVVATDVVEHIADDVEACRKMNSLLLPDGILVVTVPALPSLFGYHDEVLGHYRRYTKKSLLSLASKEFKIKHIRYYGLVLIPVALVISRWLRRPYPVQQVGETSQRKNLMARIIRFIFQFEKWITPPVGTSLLMIGSKK